MDHTLGLSPFAPNKVRSLLAREKGEYQLLNEWCSSACHGMTHALSIFTCPCADRNSPVSLMCMEIIDYYQYKHLCRSLTPSARIARKTPSHHSSQYAEALKSKCCHFPVWGFLYAAGEETRIPKPLVKHIIGPPDVFLPCESELPRPKLVVGSTWLA